MISYDTFKELTDKPYKIILDTNILLDLYRLPAKNSIEIIKLFEELMDNLFIPHQVYKEFTEEKYKVSGNAKKKYEQIEKDIKTAINIFSNRLISNTNGYRRYNYCDIDKLQNDINVKIEELHNITKKYIDDHKIEIEENKDFLQSDKVSVFLNKLKHKEHIGKKVEYSVLLNILREGELRYNNSLPPGFMDIDKKGIDKYGDLIIWKEILNTFDNKNIIFITNDKKEDWWELDKHKNPIEMRRELKNEFLENNNGVKITFFTFNIFYEYMSKKLKWKDLNTNLILGIDCFVKYLKNNSKFKRDIRYEFDKFIKDIELSDYVNVFFTDSELEFDELNISDSGEVSIEYDYVIYYININGYLNYNLSFIDEEGYEFSIGAVELEFEGRITVNRKIDSNYNCEEKYSYSEVEFIVIRSHYKDEYELNQDAEEDGLAEQMDALEEYYRH